MKYCPQCESEYLEEIKKCADCNVPLIDEDAMKKIMSEREREAQEIYVKVAILENQFESDIIRSALEKENIPVMIKTFHDTAYDGIYIPQKGWGAVLVPTEFKAQATALIGVIKKNFKKAEEK